MGIRSADTMSAGPIGDAARSGCGQARTLDRGGRRPIGLGRESTTGPVLGTAAAYRRRVRRLPPIPTIRRLRRARSAPPRRQRAATARAARRRSKQVQPRGPRPGHRHPADRRAAVRAERGGAAVPRQSRSAGDRRAAARHRLVPIEQQRFALTNTTILRASASATAARYAPCCAASARSCRSKPASRISSIARPRRRRPPQSPRRRTLRRSRSPAAATAAALPAAAAIRRNTRSAKLRLQRGARPGHRQQRAGRGDRFRRRHRPS